MKGLNYSPGKRAIASKNRYLLIPVELCSYVLKHKLLKPFKLYILLKIVTSGNIIFTTQDIDALSKILTYKTRKSFHNNLNKLISLNWIGFDSEKQKYWIRGLDEIRKRQHWLKKTAVEFGVNDFKNFEAFCFSAVIGRIAKYHAWKRRSARNKYGRAFPNLPFRRGFLPLANVFIKSYLGLSNATISKFRKLAQEAGYINFVSTFSHTCIKPDELQSFKSFDSEAYGHLYTKRQSVIEPGPSLIRIHVSYRRRKKVDT